MSVSTALFDVDGTLVNSNFCHVDTWQQAFADLGEHVDAWHIRPRDRPGLVATVTHSSVNATTTSDRARQRAPIRPSVYRQLVPRLRAFDHAADLLRVLSDRGVRVVLATSAPDDELEILLRVLECGDAVSGPRLHRCRGRQTRPRHPEGRPGSRGSGGPMPLS